MLRTMIAGLALCLLAAPGCQKEEPRTVYIGRSTPTPRPMAELKPVPARPVETAKPVERPAPAAQPAPAETATPKTAATQPRTIPQPPASQPVRAKSKPRDYVVQKNDTLWSIAKKQLGSGKRWREIVAMNPGLVPAKLMPNTVIRLPAE